LKYIVCRTNALLVLSSSWKESVLYPQLCSADDNRLTDRFMNCSGLKFVGVAPDLDEQHREIEIQQWLQTTPNTVDAFVILDDQKYGFSKAFPHNFVQTSGVLKRGLTLRQARKAIEILNCPYFLYSEGV